MERVKLLTRMLRQKRERCGFLPRVALRSIVVLAPSAPGEGQEGAALCHRLPGLSLNRGPSGSLSPQHSSSSPSPDAPVLGL